MIADATQDICSVSRYSRSGTSLERGVRAKDKGSGKPDIFQTTMIRMRSDVHDHAHKRIEKS